jgi:plasmid stabilization system protein ParE
MAYKIIWSPEAADTFEKIVDYLDKSFTKNETASFINTVNRRLLLICQLPKIGRRLTRTSRRRKTVIHKRTILFYKIWERKKEIELLSFLDTRRNNRWLRDN